MSEKSSRVERILNLLVEEISERLETAGRPGGTTAEKPSAQSAVDTEVGSEPIVGETPPEGPEQTPVLEAERGPEALPSFLQDVAGTDLASRDTGSMHAAKLMRRMAIWLFLVIVLVNIPFNLHGTTLATAMPDAASLVVRDGLVVKEEDDPEIYVYQNDTFRWISSLDAFEHYSFTWQDVHIVPDGYLDDYEIGSPIHVLLKCAQSPHIYRLEEGKKRWIRDIDTFVEVGHVWEDVRFVSCSYLRLLPDGETIPPDAGPPPQP